MFERVKQKLSPKTMWQHFLKSIRTPLGIVCTVLFAAIGIYLLSRWREFGRGANNGNSFFMYGFLLLVVLGLFTYVRFMAVITPEKTRRITIPGAAAAGLFFGVVWHYSVEIIVNAKWRKISAEHTRMSILICVIMFFFLFFLFHSLKAAAGIGSLFYFIFAVAEYYTIEFRGIPVMFYDLLDIGAAAEVAGGYVFDITKEIVLIFCLLLFVNMNILMQGDRKPGLARLSKILSRVVAAAICLITVFTIGHSASFSKSVGRVGAPLKNFREVGAQLCFIQTIKNAQISAPEGYSVSELEEVAQPYTDKAAGTVSAKEQPNVIAIMDESFADLDLLGATSLAEEIMPNYLALDENTVKGKVMVSTYGGGTGRSEFEFNTGSSMHLFSLSASPYAMFGQRMKYALAAQLKAQGYRTVAIHPFKRKNYNRPRTYEAMGFDEYLSEDSFEDSEKIRNFISDRAVFEKMCDLADETEEPLFTFCVTMQNHGGYGNSKYKASYSYGDGTFPKASQYLSLIQETDKAVGELIERLEKSDEKTIVVFFGDHLPALADTFYEDLNGATKEDAEFELSRKYYETPFFIWANYDIPEQKDVVTSLNYLGMETMELAGSRLTGYQEYLKDLKEKIPAFSGLAWYGTDGHYHKHGSDETVKELLRVYDSFEYNMLIDKKDKLTEFFALQ